MCHTLKVGMQRGHSHFLNISKKIFIVKHNVTLFNEKGLDVLELFENNENILFSRFLKFSFSKGSTSHMEIFYGDIYRHFDIENWTNNMLVRATRTHIVLLIILIDKCIKNSIVNFW